MAEVGSLISRKVPRKSMLFHTLRDAGILDLQKRAAASWTDHNVHDPGVTLLEAVCYVITEVSNQLNFPIADLIATPKGIAEANINYPSAATNLPGHPVSINDFRKIILDLPEIRNAYFEITRDSKIAAYYDPAGPPLTYDAGPNVLPVEWGGLYAIQLEFEDDGLNANLLTDTIQVSDGMTLRNVDIIISFKYWDELSEEFFRSNTITAISLEDTIVTLSEDEYEDYYSEWKVDFSDGSSVADFPVWVKLVQPLALGDPIIPNLPAALEAALKSIVATGPFASYKSKLIAVKNVTDKVLALYHANRNLGEDLSLFMAMRIQEIALHAQVEIQSTADPVEIYAQILFQIESFFTPRPAFQSLLELLADATFRVDDVFLGPMLNSGFLSDEKLNMLSRGDVIYVSDLVHIILDVKDTVALRDIFLSTFFNNFEAITNERNCLRIRGGDRYKPRLSIERSDLTLTRNGVVVVVDQTLVSARLAILRAEASVLPDTTVHDLDIPLGTLPGTTPYRSVQYELPATYGTGDSEVPLTSTSERKAQLKQLQGYLFFFDQLLANTFSQLENVGDIFSIHQLNTRTYHFQTLYHLPGAQHLLSHLGGSDPWNDFITLPDNPYQNVLRQAGESDEEFFQRRGAVLDYLLARTAEERYAYSGILSSLSASVVPEIILREKENFLENYPTLSRDRSQAYNGHLQSGGVPDVWNSSNVGGYERMVCAKLGFPTSIKRNLYRPLTDNFQFFTVLIPPLRTRFRLRDNVGNNLMVSQNHFADDAEATEAIRIFLEVGRYPDHYEIFRLTGGNFSFKLVHGPVDVVYDGATVLATRQDAENAVRVVIGILGDRYSLEGLHVVEHILLRPKIRGVAIADSDKLLNWLKIEDTLLSDPYSHLVTVVLPSGGERDFALNTNLVPSVAGYRMRNKEYQQFANQTILREAPAHLLVNVFFLDIDTDPGEAAVDDRTSLQNFERKFRAWREAMANPTATVAVRLLAQQQLVTVIEKIYGV